MIHDFCLQFSKKVAYSELTERIFTGFKTMVRRKNNLKRQTKRKNHEQTKQQTKLDSRLANGFRQDTDTKGITSSLIKDDRC